MGRPQKKTRANNFAVEFENWRKQRLKEKNFTLTSRKQANGTIITYEATEEEMKSFTQCYVSEKDGKIKYAKARDGFPEYWFISNKGSLLTMSKKNEYGEPAYVDASPSGRGNNQREQYEISYSSKDSKYKKLKKVSLDPSTVVCLVFGGDATTKAKSLLDEYGLFALKKTKDKKSMVQLHHIDGYKHGKNREEIREYRAFNCELDRIQFETTVGHKFITMMPPIDAPEEKYMDYMRKMSKEINDTKVVTMYLSNGNKAGVIKENVKFTLEDGKCKATAADGKEHIIDSIQSVYIPELEGYMDYEGCIWDDKGNVLEKEDIGAKVYDDIADFYNQNFDSIYEKYGWKPCPVGIMKKDKDGNDILSRIVYVGITKNSE